MYIRHTARHAALLVLQILVVGTLLAFLQLFAERYNVRFDLSPTQQFVLSETSKKIIASVNDAVQITAFYNSQEQGQRREMLDRLELFAEASPQITFRLVDLDRSPALAQKYGVSNAGSGVAELGGKFEAIRFIDEEGITNALLRLTRQATRRICFLEGHGEHTPYSTDERRGYSEVGKALEGENFELDRLDTVPATGVPRKCDVLVMAGPLRELLPGEADQIAAYFEGGGQILLLIDPGAPESVLQLLLRYGVRAGQDVVLDERNRLLGTDSSMLNVPAFNKKVLSANIEPAVFPVARTLIPTEEADEEGRVTVLALSSPDSWAFVNEGKLPDPNVRFRRGIDHPGPLPVGVIVTGKTTAPADGKTVSQPGRMIVFGDSDFPSNLSLNWRGNKDLFLNSIAVLAEDPTLMAIRRKGIPHGSISPIYLTETQDSLVFWIGVVAVPAAFMLVGVVLTARRRRWAGR